MDEKSGLPEAMFLSTPTEAKVVELLAENRPKHEISKRIRTDPGTIFRIKKFVKKIKSSILVARQEITEEMEKWRERLDR